MKAQTIFVLLIFAAFAVAAPANETPQKTTVPPGGSSSSLSRITVNGVGDIDPAKAFGSRNGVLVIEVFSDFQCPMCKMLYQTTLQRVADTYVSNTPTCKIYIVHRDFVLPYHAYSRTAASYSRAAAHIGKCAEVEAALFQYQEKWQTDGNVKAVVSSVLTPTEMKRVQALVDAKTLDPLIDRDRQLGESVPVRATPTMVIHTRDGNVYPVVGPVSYEILKPLLDQLISQNTQTKSR